MSDSTQNKTSIARFMFMPQWGEMLKTSAFVVPLFMRTIGNLFVQSGVLPPGHPSAYYGSPGVEKVGLFRMMGDAWRNLRGTSFRNAAPQWGTYITVVMMLGIVAATGVSVATSLAGSFVGSAGAQIFTLKDRQLAPGEVVDPNVPRTPDLKSSDIATPPGCTMSTGDGAGAGTPFCQSIARSDYALDALDKMLRLGMANQGKSMQNALGALMSVYNSAVMFVAGLMIFFLIVSVVIDVAKTGHFHGGRHNMVWAPIRIVFALAILVPLGNGFNAGQYGVVKLAELGSNLGTNGWNAYLRAVQVGNSVKLQDPPPMEDFRPLVYDYVKMWVCRVAYNGAGIEQMGEDFWKKSFDGEAGTTEMGPNVVLAQEDISARGTGKRRFVFTNASSGALCGAVELPFLADVGTSVTTTGGDTVNMDDCASLPPGETTFSQANKCYQKVLADRWFALFATPMVMEDAKRRFETGNTSSDGIAFTPGVGFNLNGADPGTVGINVDSLAAPGTIGELARNFACGFAAVHFNPHLYSNHEGDSVEDGGSLDGKKHVQLAFDCYPSGTYSDVKTRMTCATNIHNHDGGFLGTGLGASGNDGACDEDLASGGSGTEGNDGGAMVAEGFYADSARCGSSGYMDYQPNGYNAQTNGSKYPDMRCIDAGEGNYDTGSLGGGDTVSSTDIPGVPTNTKPISGPDNNIVGRIIHALAGPGATEEEARAVFQKIAGMGVENTSTVGNYPPDPHGWANMGAFYKNIADVTYAVHTSGKYPISIEPPLLQEDDTEYVVRVNEIINKYEDWVKTVPQGAAGPSSPGKAKLKHTSVWGAIGNGIKSVVGTVGGVVKGAWNMIKGFGSAIADPLGKITQALKDAFNGEEILGIPSAECIDKGGTDGDGAGNEGPCQGRTLDKKKLYPLAELSDIGSAMLAVGIAIFVCLTVLELVAAIIPTVAIGSTLAASGLAMLGNSLAAALVGNGLMLCYWLPLLPFIRVAHAVLTWMVVVFEAVMLAPIAALSFITTVGEGWNAERIFVNWLELLFRPILTVIGFVGSMLVFNTFFSYFHDAFLVAIRANFQGNTLMQIIGTVMNAIIFVVVMYTAANTTFKLLTIIPGAFYRWAPIGGSPSGFHDEGPDLGNMVKGLGASGANAVGGMAQGAGAAAGKAVGAVGGGMAKGAVAGAKAGYQAGNGGGKGVAMGLAGALYGGSGARAGVQGAKAAAKGAGRAAKGIAGLFKNDRNGYDKKLGY